MTDSSTAIEQLIEKIENYGLTGIELTKLKLLEKGIVTLTGLVAYSSVLLIILFFLFSLSVGVSLLLGAFLGKFYYGFFVVAAFYMLLAILCYFFLYRWIKKPIGNLIIKKALKKI